MELTCTTITWAFSRTARRIWHRIVSLLLFVRYARLECSCVSPVVFRQYCRGFRGRVSNHLGSSRRRAQQAAARANATGWPSNRSISCASGWGANPISGRC
ncbi:hypothetical protein BC834DRAFT_146470 [Gloeopeniophorella convolvens]|nr:hypothetical protein BC834DRAFT_146470 [Gloeopeniophorella convolvens]